MRHQLIVRTCIDRPVQLFVRLTDNQIVQYYQDHQSMIGAPLDGAIREQIQRLLAERQVNVRLTPLLEALHKRRNFELPL